MTTIRGALKKAGRDCSEDIGERQGFIGLHFCRETRRVSITARRLWTLRLAILHILTLGKATSRQVRQLVGHLTWAGLARRGFLSLFSAVYGFAQKDFQSPRPLWSSVKKELYWASTLLPLLYADTGRPWSSTVYACDAEGGSATHCGGYGVCRRELDVKEVAGLGRISERWRYDMQEFIAARELALKEEDEVLESRLWMGAATTPLPSRLDRPRRPGVDPRGGDQEPELAARTSFFRSGPSQSHWRSRGLDHGSGWSLAA